MPGYIDSMTSMKEYSRSVDGVPGAETSAPAAGAGVPGASGCCGGGACPEEDAPVVADPLAASAGAAPPDPTSDRAGAPPRQVPPELKCWSRKETFSLIDGGEVTYRLNSLIGTSIAFW